MRQVNIAEAKAHLSELVDAALEGEEIVIARRNKPAVKLSAIKAASTAKRRIGTLRGSVLYVAPDFDAPLPELADYMATPEQLAQTHGTGRRNRRT